jgi:uncharacterized protein YnzC (UPF0291/DUF896 family)
MITKEQIDRINILSKKSKSQCLTDEEKEEQKILRALYVKSFKDNLASQLKMIKVVDQKAKDKKNN